MRIMRAPRGMALTIPCACHRLDAKQQLLMPREIATEFVQRSCSAYTRRQQK
jgi:hypothetical protein